MNTILRQVRVNRGYSQARLAQQAGIAERTLQYIEACKKEPKLNTARALARALNTTVDELFPDQS